MLRYNNRNYQFVVDFPINITLSLQSMKQYTLPRKQPIRKSTIANLTFRIIKNFITAFLNIRGKMPDCLKLTLHELIVMRFELKTTQQIITFTNKNK